MTRCKTNEWHRAGDPWTQDADLRLLALVRDRRPHSPMEWIAIGQEIGRTWGSVVTRVAMLTSILAARSKSDVAVLRKAAIEAKNGTRFVGSSHDKPVYEDGRDETLQDRLHQEGEGRRELLLRVRGSSGGVGSRRRGTTPSDRHQRGDEPER